MVKAVNQEAPEVQTYGCSDSISSILKKQTEEQQQLRELSEEVPEEQLASCVLSSHSCAGRPRRRWIKPREENYALV